MRQPVKQVAYKYCVKFCKNRISVPNVVHQLTLSLRCKYCKIHSCSIYPDAINSIGPTPLGRDRATASQWRQSSITSFVSSPFGRSNVLIGGHFWRFCGLFNPKMLSAIV